MLQDIPKLGSTDPKISKAAALSIIQHVSDNKGELEYLVKRLVNGLESVKVSTRSGCYSTLAALLGLRKVDPFHLFDLMQKALITNKQSTKKERRLIYIARILCTGVIYRTSPVADLCKDQEFLKASLANIVDLSSKKSNYFQLATPFISHLLQDASLTQENFDTNVWPSLTPFFESKGKKRKVEEEGDDAEEEEEEEEEETGASDIFCCKVQLALLCKHGGYKTEFDCFKDVKKIAKALLTCRIEFTGLFLSTLFKHLAGTTDMEDFWTTIVENIKPTQFDLLCLCVEKAMEAKIPVSSIISKRLLTHLLSVFKQKDVEFHVKSRKAIAMLLSWGKTKEDSSMGKKQRKTVLRVLFGEESPNLLDEYKHVHSVIRPFLNRLKPRDLGTFHGIITKHLETPGLGIRMTITYLQFLGKIAQCKEVNAEICFEISKRLLNIALGLEKLVIKMKVEKAKKDEEEEEEEESDDDDVTEDDAQEQVKQATIEAMKTVLACSYDFEYMNLLSEYVLENSKELISDPDTLKSLKSIKKTIKKIDNPHFKYVLWAYGIRVLLEQSQVLKTSSETVSALIEMGKGVENEEEMTSELIKFILSNLLREPHVAFNFEGMFSKLIIEGQVKEDVMQTFADAIDVQLEEGEEEDSDDESLSDEEVQELEKQLNGAGDQSGSEEEDEDDDDEEKAAPPKKKAKHVEAKDDDAAHGSDSEESIDMDEATEEELKSMDNALAKVFAVKKSMKDEQNSEVRGVMRTLRLIEIYINRHSKCMPVSSLLILLMPVIHSLQNALKMKKNNGITTKVIGVLDNINRVKKFVGSDDAVEGTLASIATDLYQMANEKKNKLVRELLEHSVILITKCFLQKSKLSKKENKRFIELYVNAADTAKAKLKKRKLVKRKGKGQGPLLQTSRFVRLALQTLPEWPAGKMAIENKVKGAV